MRDVEKLLDGYKPLILSIYKRLHPMFSNKEDKEDLMAQIRLLFVNLVNEYDPRRGVDFPYYIMKMLGLRSYHYVTKQLASKNKEVLTQSFTNDEVSYSQAYGRDEFEDIINLESWDDSFTLGKKQKRLLLGLLVEHKSLKELADEEGIDVSIVHTRMHFLMKKLKLQAEYQRYQEEADD